jgi:plastocyanin
VTATLVLASTNGTPFYVLGTCLAVLAIAVTAIGLRDSNAFSSSALARAGVALFAVLVVATVTFAVRYSEDEQADRRAELASEEAKQGAAAPAPGEAAGTSQPPAAKQPTVKGPGGTLQLAASPTQIAYDKKALSSKPGAVTIDFDNPSQISHDVAIAKGSQELAKSPLIAQSKTTVTTDLAPGSYVFYCTVPGHREAGMQGTLSVK